MSVTTTLGNKAAFKRGNGDGPPETFTKVAGVTGISGLGVKSDQIDTTTFDITDNTKTKEAGLKEYADLSIDLIFDPADSTQSSSAGIIADADAQTTKNWEIDFGNAGSNKISGPGWISDVQHTAPLGQKQTLKITLTPTGKWTWA